MFNKNRISFLFIYALTVSSGFPLAAHLTVLAVNGCAITFHIKLITQ